MFDKHARAMFIPVLALALASAVAATGCGEIKKAGECSAVIDALNEGTKFEPKGKADDLSADIKGMEEWDAKIGKVEVTDAELKKHVEEYRAMVKSMADVFKTLDSATKAMEKSQDPGEIQKKAKELEGLEKKLDEIDKKETELVNKINGYCNRQ